MSSAEITEQDIEAVVGVLRSGRLALGPKVMEFEEKVAKHVGVKHAIAVSSGTAALHLIVKALGIGPGDEVLVPSFTFAASVNAILYEGATPVFVDIRPDTYNLDSNDLEKKRTSKTKAIMAVDVFGHPIDWAPVEAFAKRHKLSIIDDSCEALGAEYHGRKVGSFGDAGAFAFYPNKQITTGEGGMIVTDREDIAKLARSYRNQGRDEMGAWLEHVRMGYNYRMDEMSGALGSSQMDRLDSILAKREAVAMKYSKGLAGVEGVRIPQVLPEMKMSWFVYVITLSEGVNTEELMKDLENRGVPSRAYFSPIHLQAYLTTENVYATHSDLPVTRAICGRTIALPFHANLRDDEVDYVVNELKAILSSKKSNTNRVA
ncbi:MAG: DegT/DnrJ/EryC1/StrS family aminotransferase [Cryobacterium sp.]|nr:DegT/DnrJ/EryC1/StrS family aminotransferase [Oligoflexia bacterium]